MFEFIRARLRLRTSPASLDVRHGGLPPRFRGRPVIRRSSEEPGMDGSRQDQASSQAGQRRGLPVIDLGRSVFAPEEVGACPGYEVAHTRDFRMATSTYDALRTSAGEIELAHALDAKMRKLLGRSLRLRQVAAGSCGGCEAELVALSNVVFDMARFGVQFVASPRHADGILVTGAISANMRGALDKTYEAVPDPRIVIVVGACAISGGVFAESDEVLGGIPVTFPVDLWIPGCPPHPLTVLDGLLRMLGRLDESSRLPRDGN